MCSPSCSARDYPPGLASAVKARFLQAGSFIRRGEIRHHMEIDYPVPSIVEQTPQGERSYDIYSMLIKHRVVFIGSPIDSTLADLVVSELLYLQSDDPERGINVYVNSPGGDVDAGLAIYDTMHLVRPNVATTCIGTAVGIAALL